MASAAATENDDSIIFDHEMTKEQDLEFAAYLCDGRLFLVRLYPEQDADMRIFIWAPVCFTFIATLNKRYKKTREFFPRFWLFKLK